MKTHALIATALLAVGGMATSADAASFQIDVDGVVGGEILSFSGLIDLADPANPPDIGPITLTSFSGFTVDDTVFTLGDVVGEFESAPAFDEFLFFIGGAPSAPFFNDTGDDFRLVLRGGSSVFTDALTGPQALSPSSNFAISDPFLIRFAVQRLIPSSIVTLIATPLRVA